MKASYNLLKKFVDIEGISPQEIADKLTFAGLEVEDLSPLAQADNLVIGQIVECVNHPSSDHLHILQVDLGTKYGITQIVCGAPNARVGLKVIVARVGAHLKSINLTIQKSKIRDVESNGMCCALFELGVNKNYLNQSQIDGIEELDDSAVVGNEDVLEYLGLDDYIFDINVLANRSDCLAIFSLAKEIGALFNRKVNIPSASLPKLLPNYIKVNSETEDCPQFSIKVVNKVKVKESPSWLKNYLRSQGIRSINNIVDIGNYVMILTGQPLHMYDLDKLSSNEFVVKNNQEFDFVALDDKTYHVQNGDLVIYNGNTPGCLAGIMGAKSCAVDDSSTRIAIESANFKGATVRRTTVRTGLSSDSSAHFIKGINPYQDQYVLDLTAQLLVELADAEEVYESARYTTIDYNIKPIETTYSYINKRLGTNFSIDEINHVLIIQGMLVNQIDNDKFTVIPPQHRIDIKCDADISEEVIRFIGLDKVLPKLMEMETTVGGLSPDQLKKRKIRTHLIENGLNETLTYTLVSPSLVDQFVVLNNDEPIKVKNPMTVDHSLLRKGLVASLLEVVKYNQAHQNKNISIFEISDVSTCKTRYEELCVVLSGEKLLRGSLKKQPYDFYDISGIFESILQLLKIDTNRFKTMRLTSSPYYHPGRCVGVYFGKELVGCFGQIHPNFEKEYGTCFVLDLNLTKFMDLRTSQMKMQPISKFPSVERDYAFVMKKDILAQDVIKCVKKESRGLIQDVRIFDVYEGEFLDEGFKSIALTITYSSLEKTLNDSDINVIESNVLNALNRNFGAYLRS